jgi:TrpR-related protein YerC/YecD
MYKSKFANQDIDDLYEAILTLDSVEECYRFFEDLCTVKEIFDMA